MRTSVLLLLLLCLVRSCCTEPCQAATTEWTAYTPGVQVGRPADFVACWYQAGCGDSDRFLADWPELRQDLAKHRIGWSKIDVAVPVNTAAARINGITRLPAFSIGGRWYQGYKGREQFLQLLGICQMPRETPRPENKPAPLPPVSRPRSQDVVTTSAFEAALKGLRQSQEELGSQMAALRTEWVEAHTNLEGFLADWDESLRDLDTRISKLSAREDERWTATTAGMEAIADVDRRISSIEGRLATGGAITPSPSVGSVDAHPAKTNGGPGTLPSENKEFRSPDDPSGSFLKKWSAFGATAIKIGLGIAAPEVSLPLAGLTAAGTLFRWLRRRRASRNAPDYHTSGPDYHTSGNLATAPEVRDDRPFPRIFNPGPEQPPQPGEYEKTETGYVRSQHGGPVPDRFAGVDRGPASH